MALIFRIRFAVYRLCNALFSDVCSCGEQTHTRISILNRCLLILDYKFQRSVIEINFRYDVTLTLFRLCYHRSPFRLCHHMLMLGYVILIFKFVMYLLVDSSSFRKYST